MDKELNAELLALLKRDFSIIEKNHPERVKMWRDEHTPKVKDIFEQISGIESSEGVLQSYYYFMTEDGELSDSSIEGNFAKELVEFIAPGIDGKVIEAIDAWRDDDRENNELTDEILKFAEKKLTFSQRLLTPKVKNSIAGFGALCILGAVGQGINMADNEDVSIISILVFLLVGVALVWFSKFKK